jgi:prevent-host-death family protein
MTYWRKRAMNQETIGVAQAKKTFSDLLGQVAYGKKRIVITKRGKPVALLSPPESAEPIPFKVGGWLDASDPFFEDIEKIVQERVQHKPRVSQRKK